MQEVASSILASPPFCCFVSMYISLNEKRSSRRETRTLNLPVNSRARCRLRHPGFHVVTAVHSLHNHDFDSCIFLIHILGDVAQMVERVLSMHEAQGSIPCFSTFFLPFSRYCVRRCSSVKKKCLDRGSNTGPLDDTHANRHPTVWLNKFVNHAIIGRNYIQRDLATLPTELSKLTCFEGEKSVITMGLEPMTNGLLDQRSTD